MIKKVIKEKKKLLIGVYSKENLFAIRNISASDEAINRRQFLKLQFLGLDFPKIGNIFSLLLNFLHPPKKKK